MPQNIDPQLAPIHPGEVLMEDFLSPMGVTPYRLAKSIGVDATRVSEIIRGKRSISADTALRLGLFFGMEPQFWMNLQARHDLEATVLDAGERIRHDVVPLKAVGT